jgi:hypothetical protein
VFPRPSQILRAREGSLAEVPLPLLLHALSVEGRSCVLELKVRQLEKRIRFEDGTPVGCRSNLLHETLGKFLVGKGLLPEDAYQKVLGESVQSGRQMGELLIQKQLITPFDLFRQLQANLAVKILDCFRWTDARYRLVAEDARDEGVDIRVNVAQLLLTGIGTIMPFDAVATHFPFTDEQRFAATPEHSPHAQSLKLSARDARLLQALEGQPDFATVMARTGLDTEAAMRRLYAFAVLGLLHFADEVARLGPPPRRASASAGTPKAPVPGEGAPPAGLAFLDAEQTATDALLRLFLEHRRLDPFQLLGVEPRTAAQELRRAFLDRLQLVHPARYQSTDFKEKAEVLAAAMARAYGVLSDPELLELWTRRRKAAEEKERQMPRPDSSEQFRIRTDLLDASAQLDEGRRRLEAGNIRGAFEYFEYACDIDPRPLHRGWRAWARYLLDPTRNGRLAQQELEDVLRAEPALEQAWAWLGEVQLGLSNRTGAAESFRRAYQLNPARRDLAERLRELAAKR